MNGPAEQFEVNHYVVTPTISVSYIVPFFFKEKLTEVGSYTFLQNALFPHDLLSFCFLTTKLHVVLQRKCNVFIASAFSPLIKFSVDIYKTQTNSNHTLFYFNIADSSLTSIKEMGHITASHRAYYFSSVPTSNIGYKVMNMYPYLRHSDPVTLVARQELFIGNLSGHTRPTTIFRSVTIFLR
jgi:hypothetical protein